jgi:hypothetical protein
MRRIRYNGKRLQATALAIGWMALVVLLPQWHNELQAEDSNECPLEVLNGRWAFNTAGTGLPFDKRGQSEDDDDDDLEQPLGPGLKRGLGQPVASAGSFVASVDPKAEGVLTITTTTSRNGQIVQLETGDGSYERFPDCSGGTLTWYESRDHVLRRCEDAGRVAASDAGRPTSSRSRTDCHHPEGRYPPQTPSS